MHMKRNIDQFLIKYLTNNKDDTFVVDDQEFHTYRFYMVGNVIHLITDDDCSTKLGEFDQINKFTYRLLYYYDVNCLINMSDCKNLSIKVIQRMYSKDVNKRLVAYLTNR